MHTRIFFLLLSWVSLLAMLTTCETTIQAVKKEINLNDVKTRDPRLFPFRWKLSNIFSNKKPAPVYLLSGTVCRYINMMPVCTYLSTSGVAVSNPGISSAQLVGSSQTRPLQGMQSGSSSMSTSQSINLGMSNGINLGGQSGTGQSGSGQSGGGQPDRGQSGSSQSGGGQSSGSLGQTGSRNTYSQGLSLAAIYAGTGADKNIADLQYSPNTNHNIDDVQDINNLLPSTSQTTLNQPQQQQNSNNISTRQSAKPIGFLVLKQRPTSKLSNLLRVKSQFSALNPELSYVLGTQSA